jgi:hypothetical protein
MDSIFIARKIPYSTIGVNRPVLEPERRWMEAGRRILK